MNTTLRNQSATNLTLIETTPEALREIATRLELSEQNSHNGQYVTIPFTDGIMLASKSKPLPAPKASVVMENIL